MIHSTLKYLLLLTLNLYLPIAQADIYKSVDSQGHVTYSQQPPAQNAQKIDVNITPPSNSTVGERDQALINKQTQDKQTQNEELQKQQASTAGQNYQKQVEDTCKQYRSNLDVLNETGRRVYTTDSTGQYHYLSDDERAAQVKQLNDNIKTWCKP